MGNKQVEEDCLDKVFENIEKYDQYTRTVLYKLKGESFLDDQERPDFILLHKNKDKAKKDLLVGIEHFEIAHTSELNEERTKVNFLDYSSQKAQAELLQKYTSDDVEITEELRQDFSSYFSNHFVKWKNARYQDFLNSFFYSYNKHKQKVQIYHDRLKTLAGSDYNYEICFMFDIRYHFQNYCLFDGKQFSVQTYPLPIIFQDMIDIIENNNDRRVKHIIFVITDDMNKNNYWVYAFNNQNINKRLKECGLPVFKYLVAEYSQEIQIGANSNGLKVECTTNQQDIIYQLGKQTQEVLRCLKNRELFVTNNAILQCYRQYGNKPLQQFANNITKSKN